MAPTIKVYFFVFATFFFLNAALANSPHSRSLRRLHLPFLGIGPRCNGCPQNFCDDDPAIVHGYCCGCARFYDSLPVTCGVSVRCPLNNYDLCEDYEYMMSCCCS